MHGFSKRSGLQFTEFSASLSEQLAQDGPMAAGVVLAIAAHGKIGLVRESGEQVEEVSCVGEAHFGSKTPLEGAPGAPGLFRPFSRGALDLLQKRLAGGEGRQP